MALLIGIAGKARAGKDTAANRLRQVLDGSSHTLHFAGPLKEMAAAFAGEDLALYYDDVSKEEVIPWLGVTRRSLLQTLGSEAVKPHLGNDVWVKRLMVDVEANSHLDFIIVPDVRFDLEAQAIKDRGGVILHISRAAAGLPGALGAHASEAGIDPMLVDVDIENDTSIQSFWIEVDRFAHFATYIKGAK